MLSKRIISCLDVRDGKLAKSVKFVDTKDIGDPVEKARQYYLDGLDELVFYDITASSDKRNIMIDVVDHVARQVFIPFSVGGGLRTVEDCSRVLHAGAEKINVNSAAVLRPELISETSLAFGAQCVVLSMDVKQVSPSKQIPSGYEIVINGGRKPMGIDALWWAKTGEDLGAGELVVNSIDADGTKDGYDIALTRAISETVRIPVIASGGGGTPRHLYEVLTEGKADAALIASILHYGEYTVSEIKTYLAQKGLPIRLTNREE
ncbi:imidazole glycerol phosphate synthase subunit HisF [Chitinivibrio alkaliphilus]|uniref:Imidazole glycerol phosphate synthase subunit HisF n=1 Tax=Chitinivibrio alkaliphilus ACht1 TaxID=1313304 RepID=U7D3Z4_9BACT|nr:imidazole glycerol phosphate synthase subunit HisF [Chitinivibrio alkaliphilus]ERP30668.1 imidazole glycerol phosphate synthase subunit HisF [Chitinivibrio alkaliphilus ACht1]